MSVSAESPPLCNKCGKPRKLFGKRDRRWRCRPCETLLEREYYNKNRDDRLAKDRVWREKNRAKVVEYGRRWRAENPERHDYLMYRGNLRRKFGITPEDAAALLEKQGGVCGICGGPPVGRSRYHVDHDHKSGAIRGLLCGKCNTGLGQFNDSPELLHRAAAYLKKSS